tara:strand:+ start:778 stop:1167 length:390 start_codon:yes stop_codon:yes gene_type:complete
MKKPKDDDKKFSITIGDKTISPSYTYESSGTISSVTNIDPADISYCTSDISSTYAGPTYTLGDMNDTGGEFSINFDDFETRPEVWPSQHTIEEMIKEYPALALQYTRFIELYNLCKDDYYSGKKNDGLL